MGSTSGLRRRRAMVRAASSTTICGVPRQGTSSYLTLWCDQLYRPSGRVRFHSAEAGGVWRDRRILESRWLAPAGFLDNAFSAGQAKATD